jgi:hypothetical protein
MTGCLALDSPRLAAVTWWVADVERSPPSGERPLPEDARMPLTEARKAPGVRFEGVIPILRVMSSAGQWTRA